MLERIVDLLKPQVPSIINRALTAAGLWLVGQGVLTQSGEAQFIQIGSAIGLIILSEAWAWYRNNKKELTINTLANHVSSLVGATPPEVVAVAAKGITPTVSNMLACILALFLAMSLTGCLTPQQAKQVDKAAVTAVDVQATVAPQTIAKVDAACPAVQTGIKAVLVAAKSAHASPDALKQIRQNYKLAEAACTEEGKQALAINDTKPPSVTNSGNSWAWLVGLLPDALKIAGIVLPMVL